MKLLLWNSTLQDKLRNFSFPHNLRPLVGSPSNKADFWSLENMHLYHTRNVRAETFSTLPEGRAASTCVTMIHILVKIRYQTFSFLKLL